ncbi:MAG: 50S ribosomal protein L4 [Armatimonadota bacterium]
MPSVSVLSKDGTQTGSLELSEKVFGRQGGEAVVHRALVTELANARQGTASTKTRGEVSGGGRKPWRQKGTGRARHGSIRSPIWTHGGVVFGPKPRDYNKSINKKEKRAAMMYALSARLAEGAVTVVDDLSLPAPKTKEMVALLSRLGIEGKTLVVVSEYDETLRRASANLPNVQLRVAPNLAIRDVLWADRILGTADALRKLEENLAR